ncbi:MAG TPA: fatty acyl-AMP ligase [Myxococcales bacterium]|jgi:fatty-acyl-CoA synthase|nr:fatty acyl-AMP ligase [Myxococcales bacterium]
MKGVIESLDACEGVRESGFTFVGAKGAGEDLVLSFHDVRLAAQQRAAHFLSNGIVRGDRIALVIPEGEHFIPAFLGGLWMGAVPVPLYPPLSLGKLDAFMDALVTILNVAKPKALVTTERVAKILWSAVGRIPSLTKVIIAEDLQREPAGTLPPVASFVEDDLAFLQFTSGSTSLPKGVMVTHGSLAANCKAIVVDCLKVDPKHDVAVSWLPLYHDMGLIGLVLAPVFLKIPTVFIPTLSFVKNATLWMETLSKYKGTLSFAPNFAYALVTKRARAEQLARWDLSRMRVFGCGSEPINPETMRNFVEKFAAAGVKPTSLLPCYGMAEATLAISFIGLDETLKVDSIDEGRYHKDRKAAPGTGLEVVNCGRVMPGHEISVQDDDGRILPERAVGQLCFKGPSVAKGYWESPEATREAGFGGWLRTGDLGYIAGGEVYVSGRIKDILIINGRNYYPQRIEWLVDELPGVRKGSTVVFTRPGASSEEIVVAAETRDRDEATLKALIMAKVSEEFSLSVSDVALVPPGALPKTSSGKLQRRKTRDQYLTGKLGKAGRGGSTRLAVAKHLALSWVGRAKHGARGLLKRLGA